MKTKKSNRELIAGYAKTDFAEHRLIPEQTEGPVRMWYCGREGTGIYSFRVVAGPGMLLVYGDVGDYMIQASDKDLIPWLKAAINSESYLISKFIRKSEIFLSDEAELLLDRLVEEAQADGDEDEDKAVNFRSTVLYEWNKDYDGEHEFCKAFIDAGGDYEDLSVVKDFGPDVYWTVECLKKFVELLNEFENKDNDTEGTCSSYATLA